MSKYLRYFGTHLLILATLLGFVAGGPWCWAGLLVGVVFWIGGDAISVPVAKRGQSYRHPRIFDVALYSLLPSLVLMSFAFAWAFSSTDLMGFGAWVAEWAHRDVLEVRLSTTSIDHLGACLSFGLAIAMGGILTAHELGHRTNDPAAIFVARWMLAMAFNSSLEVAHVFGHHRDVGTTDDPATARRGESIYRFFVRSTTGQFFQAWRIERARLHASDGLSFYFRNKVFRGLVRSGLVATTFFLAGGWLALSAFLVSSMWNKFLLESLNYAEHYGLVRVPDMPFERRHAWDSESAFSHGALFNLPWHADHHKRAGVHYPDLTWSPGAPLLSQGYLATLPLIWVPPLWYRMMKPKLANWDVTLASPEERDLLQLSN